LTHYSPFQINVMLPLFSLFRTHPKWANIIAFKDHLLSVSRLQ
jgi:hypothetical protein